MNEQGSCIIIIASYEDALLYRNKETGRESISHGEKIVPDHSPAFPKIKEMFFQGMEEFSLRIRDIH